MIVNNFFKSFSTVFLISLKKPLEIIKIILN